MKVALLPLPSQARKARSRLRRPISLLSDPPGTTVPRDWPALDARELALRGNNVEFRAASLGCRMRKPDTTRWHFSRPLAKTNPGPGDASTTQCCGRSQGRWQLHACMNVGPLRSRWLVAGDACLLPSRTKFWLAGGSAPGSQPSPSPDVGKRRWRSVENLADNTEKQDGRTGVELGEVCAPFRLFPWQDPFVAQLSPSVDLNGRAVGHALPKNFPLHQSPAFVIPLPWRGQRLGFRSERAQGGICSLSLMRRALRRIALCGGGRRISSSHVLAVCYSP